MLSLSVPRARFSARPRIRHCRSSKTRTSSLLASTYGGDIVVKQGAHGSLVAQDAVYRVMIQPLGGVHKADFVIHGSVRIETSFRFLAENFVYRIISLFIRESGI